jgi:hypothetical protein
MSTTDRPIPVRRNVNDPQRPRTPISEAQALAEPPETRTFPEQDLPAITDAERKAAAEKAPKPQIMLSTTVQHRGRTITITAKDITVDRFCDLLEAAQYAAPAPQQWQTLPDGTPLCPKHSTPMRKREKQGDEWWSHRVFGPDGQELFCKGYHGKDSPGYEH